MNDARFGVATDVVDEHRFCSEHLPWFVTGSLDPLRARRVEVHLASCQRCHDEHAREQALCALVNLPQGVELAPQAGLAAVMERIARREAWRQRLAGPLRMLFGERAQRPLVLAVAIQALVIVMLTTVLGVALRSPTAAQYRTLSTPQTAVPDAAAGQLVRLVLADDLSLRDLQGLLTEVQGRIVAGPEGAGIYTIEVGTTVDAAVALLRGRRGVRMAEPVLPVAEVR
jgi:anti-sigma factor RsiW